MANFVLEFLGQTSPELEKTVFLRRPGAEPICSCRGAVSANQSTVNLFRWSSAVHALSILCVTSRRIYSKHDSTSIASIQGEKGSPAASLDYAISKQTNWLLDMFGWENSSSATIQRLFIRKNPERKRPGPVEISFNNSLITGRDITIKINGDIVDDESELLSIEMTLLDAWKSPKNLPTSNEQLIDTSHRFSKDITPFVPQHTAEYLELIKQHLHITHHQNEEDIRRFLIQQIKHLCITSEIIHTNLAANRKKQSLFYSCSALVDTSPDDYLQDAEWRVLLNTMGRSKQKSNSAFSRVFFFPKLEFGLQEDATSIQKIINLHLEQGIDVYFVDQDDLSVDLQQKKNIACIGGEVLIDATDQQTWDLDITQRKGEIRIAQAKHETFRELAYEKFLTS